MPYDYSLRFLGKHAQLVKELQDLATTGAVMRWSSKDWEIISRQQALVNNLLASMSRNVIGLEKIRSTMACWTQFGTNGEYQLHVGHWSLRPKKGEGMGDLFVPAGHAAALVYRHLDQGHDALDTFNAFDTKLRALAPSYKRAEIELPIETREAPAEAMIEWAAEKFEPWKVRIEGINLILER